MMAFVLNSATFVWLLLVMATCLTGWLAETEHGVRWAVIAMLLIASAKIWLIMQHFMELKSAPPAWRLTLAVWLVIVTAVVLSDYWLF